MLVYNIQASRPCSHRMKEALKGALKPRDVWTSQDSILLVWEWHAGCSRSSGSPTELLLESTAQTSYNIQKG